MNVVIGQIVARQSYRLCFRTSNKYLLVPVTSRCPDLTSRNFCDKVEARRLPQLMEFPPIVWPSLINFIKNWMFANFIIRPYFDREFRLAEFVEASKHAVQVVSESLQNSEFKALDELVEKDALCTLKSAISRLSVSQRQLLGINKEDIFYAFPYQVGVIFDDSEKRWVEITMCYHVLRGLKQMKDSGDLPPITLGGQPEFQDKIFILNYRFIREYTKDVEDSWWINIVNHFQPQNFRQ
ncbi:m-AAA protease-interacting protein 1, mitochondrial [Leptidea sinapis]|uniref:Tim44-like domain-containing protein n=1 Tax=Leptidea sinapis TaxID=189913 RepID=A0A5E4PNL0_9NEOP|nr:m-AAA protease-interacting protein 1, mitochondrial [Leptidea sinapis]VVC86891.1 unnamed protein product [Leptidea sinapis]